MNIALHIAETADTILNGLIILVLVYFSIIVISIGIREYRDTRKRRQELERNVHR